MLYYLHRQPKIRNGLLCYLPFVVIKHFVARDFVLHFWGLWVAEDKKALRREARYQTARRNFTCQEPFWGQGNVCSRMFVNPWPSRIPLAPFIGDGVCWQSTAQPLIYRMSRGIIIFLAVRHAPAGKPPAIAQDKLYLKSAYARLSVRSIGLSRQTTFSAPAKGYAATCWSRLWLLSVLFRMHQNWRIVSVSNPQQYEICKRKNSAGRFFFKYVLSWRGTTQENQWHSCSSNWICHQRLQRKISLDNQYFKRGRRSGFGTCGSLPRALGDRIGLWWIEESSEATRSRLAKQNPGIDYTGIVWISTCALYDSPLNTSSRTEK